MSAASYDRLELLARYARTVVAQEERLAAGDEDGFVRRAEERRELQERVDALPPVDAAADVDPGARAEVVRLLREARSAHERMWDRMKERRARSRSEVQEVERRGDQAKRYLDSGRDVERSLDLTL